MHLLPPADPLSWPRDLAGHPPSQTPARGKPPAPSSGGLPGGPLQPRHPRLGDGLCNRLRDGALPPPPEEGAGVSCCGGPHLSGSFSYTPATPHHTPPGACCLRCTRTAAAQGDCFTSQGSPPRNTVSCTPSAWRCMHVQGRRGAGGGGTVEQLQQAGPHVLGDLAHHACVAPAAALERTVPRGTPVAPPSPRRGNKQHAVRRSSDDSALTRPIAPECSPKSAGGHRRDQSRVLNTW